MSGAYIETLTKFKSRTIGYKDLFEGDGPNMMFSIFKI